MRRITAADGARLREVRLAALADAPDAFWRTFDAEAARPEEDWHRRATLGARGTHNATFLLEDDGVAIGLVTVYPLSRAPEFHELAGMWVAPTARGSGGADLLVDAAVAWARETGATGVRLWVETRNARACRFYARLGFTPLGAPQPDDDPTAGKSYLLMVLSLEPGAAASPAFLERAQTPWADESG